MFLFEPARLLHLVHPGRKSVSKTPPEYRIIEESVKEGLERDQFGDAGEDCGQFPKASEGLR